MLCDLGGLGTLGTAGVFRPQHGAGSLDPLKQLQDGRSLARSSADGHGRGNVVLVQAVTVDEHQGAPPVVAGGENVTGGAVSLPPPLVPLPSLLIPLPRISAHFAVLMTVAKAKRAWQRRTS